jgi:2-polyprenyl-6-methoxyphenol hydroxylase-like FAD-dependent oxidoreductase
MTDGSRDISARLVVGAGGRNSTVRAAGGFDFHRDPDTLLMAGLLWDNMRLPDDTAQVLLQPDRGALAAFFPQGQGRVRTYYAYHKDSIPRIQGEQDLGRFIQAMLEAGAKSYFCNARPAGPLASFECAHAWVSHPYREGIALIGDAACTTDPSWGQGLSTTLRDVRLLTQHLLSNHDWHAAGHAYADDHDRYSSVVRTVIGWLNQFFMDPGEHAQALRARALPRIAQDPTRVPDHVLCGPDLPADEAVRLRFFGEDSVMVQTAS